MSSDRWKQIEEAYHGARDLSGEERSRFLDQRCGSDQALREQIERLLAQDENVSGFLNRPAIEFATELRSVANVAPLTGRRIGVYEVLEHIGSGGMGEVYRARDTKLNRDVALKVLPPAVAFDKSRVARFTREAQVLASLNHPNIAAIYGLEESDGVQALVLELVDGPTVADRIARGPIPLDEALSIARQVADALETAHELGIIHRDLKPANIKLRPDGTVKVLDFGLAKAIASATEADTLPTNSPPVTMPGIVLGTPGYMSPEQTKGQSADKRADVWAFGCVLFEMLSGKRAFAGDHLTDTFAAVLRDEPKWGALPPSMPEPIRALIEGCLQKDPRERVPNLSTARFLLGAKRFNRAGGAVATPPPLWKRAGLVAAAAVAGAIIGGLAVLWKTTYVSPTPQVARFSIRLSEDQEFTNLGRQQVSISPDGSTIAYIANQSIYVRLMSDALARRLTTPAGPFLQLTNPTFSPDGKTIAFWSWQGQILKIDVSGGTPVLICSATNPTGMTWSDDGLFFGQANGVMRVGAQGGTPELVASVDGADRAYGPQALPMGRGILFTLGSGDRDEMSYWDNARIVVQESKGSKPITLLTGGSDARYLPTGHILYSHQGRVFAVSFDPRALRVTSPPVPVLDGVTRSMPATAAAQFAVSSSGSLVYIPGPASLSKEPQYSLAHLGQGGPVRLKLPPGSYETPRVSPDGKRLAYGTRDDDDTNVWIYDLDQESGVPRRLTSRGKNRFPVWSADGRYIAFQSDREKDLAIFRQPWDIPGSNAKRLTTPSVGTDHLPESWSRNDMLSFSVRKGSRYSLNVLSVRDGTIVPFEDVDSPLPLASDFSPDGRLIAYASSEADTARGLSRTTISVEPLPRSGRVNTVGLRGRGYHPTWLRNGKGLSYSTGVSQGGPQWVITGVTTQPNFAELNTTPVLNRGLLDSTPQRRDSLERNYDLTRDGRIALLLDDDVRSKAPIEVVLNWAEELKRRVPSK